MRRYHAPHSGQIISDFHMGGTCAPTRAYSSQKTCHSQTDAPPTRATLDGWHGSMKPEGRRKGMLSAVLTSTGRSSGSVHRCFVACRRA